MGKKNILEGMYHIFPKIIRKEKPKQIQQCINIFIIPYLYEAQQVSSDTPPIIRSLKLHGQPLVFHMLKVVGRVVGGRCQTVHATPVFMLAVRFA
jgi:hypothetical protein